MSEQTKRKARGYAVWGSLFIAAVVGTAAFQAILLDGQIFV